MVGRKKESQNFPRFFSYFIYMKFYSSLLGDCRFAEDHIVLILEKVHWIIPIFFWHIYNAKKIHNHFVKHISNSGWENREIWKTRFSDQKYFKTQYGICSLVCVMRRRTVYRSIQPCLDGLFSRIDIFSALLGSCDNSFHPASTLKSAHKFKNSCPNRPTLLPYITQSVSAVVHSGINFKIRRRFNTALKSS